MQELHELQLSPIITRALEEDWGYGDWTTDLCVPKEKMATARLITREAIVVSGVDVVRAVFAKVDRLLKLEVHVSNGQRLKANEVIVTISGSARSILKGERVALNFLGRMCGIATTTSQYVEQLAGTKCQLLDTRKTTPGLRLLEKAATVAGGARNHRVGLCDGVIVKENHIRAAGGIKAAVSRLLEALPPTLKIEVEATTLDEVQEALDAGADIIMLDNMPLAEMALAVRTARGRAKLEASGGVKLDTVRKIAETGVDYISTGSTIHSSRWADLSLLFDREK
ncbi:MAG: carboxylating nicotinate-nucleotide diphosphorylase [Proteobacteria bacterium]|nr:carboxylating nicotinate-nucleotide diphosphorylase [Pseudomonadota bacterium]